MGGLVDRACAWSMLVAPLPLVIGFGLHLYLRLLPDPPPGTTFLQRLASDAGVVIDLAHTTILFGVPLLLVSALGLARLLADRRPGLALHATAAAVTGAVFMGALLGATALAPTALATLPADRLAALQPGLDAVLGYRGWMPVAYLGFLLPAALIALAAGLYRERVVPRPAAAAVAVGSALLFFDPVDPVLFTGSVLLQLGLGAVGLRILRQPTPDPLPPAGGHPAARPVTA